MFSLTKSFLNLAPLVSVAFSLSVSSSKPVDALTKRVVAAAADGSGPDFTCYYFTPPGRILAFVGEMTVPQNNPVTTVGTNFVWPGVTTTNEVGTVLQNVINGYPETNGQWSVFQNWLVGPDNTYGTHRDGSVPVTVGEKLSFSMKISADGQSWDINSNGATDNYPFHDDFPNAVFCGEFYQSSWQFGDLVFENVQIVAQTSDPSWCVPNGTSTLGSPTGQWSDVTYVTDEGGNVVCNIGRLVMNVQ